jgi:gluconate 2-dehydrogenase gamma chain
LTPSLPSRFSAGEQRVLAAACDRLIPPDDQFPGAARAGAPGYVNQLLRAFDVTGPPLIWSRTTGERAVAWLQLGPAEEHAWRLRVERWQAAYDEGLQRLGADFAELDGDAQDERLAADPEFRWLLYEHCCEAVYGDPAYGGNRDRLGWRSIGFPGDPFPHGYTDAEVTDRD